ncbi:MAG TPA: hypothetical protein PKJ24_04980 [Prolixibacteraceae bacterium]|nr:hypothetical protein [Prolixibacteraceae bacterium]
MNKIIRKDSDPPAATAEWGWRFHHLGIPTAELIPDEEYFEKFKLAHGGFPTSPFGVEWMRFEEGSPVHELIKKVPHLAFEVDDLEAELAKHPFIVISPLSSPSPGTRVIMIEHNGAPIELIEFTKCRAESESGG